MVNESRLEINQLAPYITVSLLRLRSRQTPPALEQHQNRLQDIFIAKIDERQRSNLRLDRIMPFEPTTISNWRIFGIWYRLSQAPYWLKEVSENNDIYDVKHHLALMLMNSQYGVLAFSDAAFRRRLRQYLIAEYRVQQEPFFEAFTKDELSQAFLGGQARQTWMHGVHTPITTKPDSKIMTGIDLRDSIDPFSDQTYYLNAALSDIEAARMDPDFRSNLPENSSLRELESEDAIGDSAQAQKNRLLGISFKNNIVWTRISRNMRDFVAEVDGFIDMISYSEDPHQAHQFGFDQAGYDMLQRPSKNITSLDQLGKPVDIFLDLAFPSEEEEETSPREYIDALHDWLENWEMVLSDESDMEDGTIFANALYRGSKMARVRIQPILLGDGKVDFRVNVIESYFENNRNMESRFDHILDDIEEKISIWYTEGYTIREKHIYDLKYRDVPFDRWTWLNLKGYNANEEKPDPAQEYLSLFEFVINETAQIFDESDEWYLICDDRSGEIADFIYIDNDRKRIGLVHVKAAGHAKSRWIAPAKYQIVTQQASKNLRFLDVSNLVSGLERETSRGILQKTWRSNGNELIQLDDRREAIQALKNIGAFPEKFVVILQPHTTKSVWREQLARLRSDSAISDHAKYQLLRLKTMIVHLEEACKRFGASLIMCGEDDDY